MAGKKIKFALKMADGTQIRHLEDLRGHIKNNNDFKKIVEYFLDERKPLVRWLLQDERKYEKEAMDLRSLNKNDPDFTCKLCKALGIDYTSLEPVNLELIEYEMKMRKSLEGVTSDSEIISNAGCTASTQSELVFLINNGKNTIIYLWGGPFRLPVISNISYIGILGKTSVDIGLPDLEAINRYGIKLENVNLPERFKEEERRKAEEEARRAEEETRKTFDPVKNAKVGDYIKFGNYPQSAIGTFQPIEWLVLARENNQVLVISRYGLDARRFDSSSNNWKNSEIRQWLNSEFYNKAFNEKDKRYINPFNDDNVFLLAKEEVEIYFANNNAIRCNSNDYAKNNGAYVADNGYSWWWLRSPRPYSNSVYRVGYGGDIQNIGVEGSRNVVRPALWINLDSNENSKVNNKVKLEEARRKAEEKARRRAEEEARRKTEEEARRRAEEEARRRTEEEARRKAKEESRRKVDSILKGIEINKYKSRETLLSEMNKYTESFGELVSASKLMNKDEIVEMLIKIITWTNVQIICYITGIRITDFLELNTEKIPIFKEQSMLQSIFNDDKIKSFRERFDLFEICKRVKSFGNALYFYIKDDTEEDKGKDKGIFKKIHDITENKFEDSVDKNAAVLLQCSIIDIDYFIDETKKFLKMSYLMPYLLITLSVACCNAYNYNYSFNSLKNLYGLNRTTYREDGINF